MHVEGTWLISFSFDSETAHFKLAATNQLVYST